MGTKQGTKRERTKHLTECWLVMFPDDEGALCTCDDYSAD